MRKTFLSMIAGVMMLSTAALYAGSAILAWDYDFTSNPEAKQFKTYAVAGSNTVFTANNANATKVATVSPGTNQLSGVQIGLTNTVSGLSPGYWTFTVTALSTNGVESLNATSATGLIRPGKPTNVDVQ
jgi:hypothetical protein